MGEQTSETLLPVHLQPKTDELLSSWLVRLAIAHAMKPETFYSLLSPRNPRLPLHIDETTDARVLYLIKSVTGLSIERVKATTLATYRETLPRYYSPGPSGLRSRSMSYQWVMPISSARSQYQLFGLQYCPDCLSKDEAPYFRRRWRFAFVTMCGTHRILLLDRCTHCGLPIDFIRNASKAGKKQGMILTMTRCHSCNFDVRAAVSLSPPHSTFSDDFEFQEFLLKALEKEEVQVHPGESHPVALFFHKLYCLANLVAFGKFGAFIRTQLCERYGIKKFAVVQPEKYRSLEVLNVGERFGLMRVAGRVMREWPNDIMTVNWTNHGNLPYPPPPDDVSQ